MTHGSTMPSVGALRQRAQIQSRTLAANSFGEQVPTWATIATVWCNVTALSGREIWQQQVQADVTHQVDMRYLATVGPKCRIAVDGMTLNVQSAINPDGRKRFTKAMCIQEVST